MCKKSAVDMTEVKAETGVHQGSALNPFLFVVGSDRLADGARQESPRTMLFADDIVVCSESRAVGPQKERNRG